MEACGKSLSPQVLYEKNPYENYYYIIIRQNIGG